MGNTHPSTIFTSYKGSVPETRLTTYPNPFRYRSCPEQQVFSGNLFNSTPTDSVMACCRATGIQRCHCRKTCQTLVPRQIDSSVQDLPDTNGFSAPEHLETGGTRWYHWSDWPNGFLRSWTTAVRIVRLCTLSHWWSDSQEVVFLLQRHCHCSKAQNSGVTMRPTCLQKSWMVKQLRAK